MARIVAIVVVAALAAMPAGALGAIGGAGQSAPAPPVQQQAPLQNQAPEAPQPAPAELPESEVESRIGPGTLMLVIAGVVVLLGGVWYVIARDARRATAGRIRTQTAGDGLGGTRAARRSRKLSSAERKRRRRGRAR